MDVITKRRKKYRGKPKKRKKVKWIFIVSIISFLLCFLLYYTNSHIKPVVSNIAQMKAKQMAIKVINEAVYEEITQKFNKNDLINKEIGENKKVSNLTPNTVNINRLSTKTQLLIQKKLDAIGSQTIQVPIGNLFDNQLISNIGPKIPIRMMVMGNAKVNYYTDFKSDGINQTKYKITIVIKVVIQSYIAIAKVESEVSETVPIAEAIIVGPIPTTYVQVPTANDSGNYISGGISADSPIPDNK